MSFGRRVQLQSLLSPHASPDIFQQDSMLLHLPLPSSNLLVSFVKSDRPLAASGTPGIWPSKKGYQMKIKLSLKADWTVARDSHMKTGGQVIQVRPGVVRPLQSGIRPSEQGALCENQDLSDHTSSLVEWIFGSIKDFAHEARGKILTLTHLSS